MRKRLVLISEKFNNYSIKIRFVNSVCTTQWCLNVDEREKKSSPYLSSTQWYSNIFWVGKPIKRNDLIWAFWGHQGRFWGWKKKLAFQLCFTCYGIFPTRNALKLTFVFFQLQLYGYYIVCALQGLIIGTEKRQMLVLRHY